MSHTSGGGHGHGGHHGVQGGHPDQSPGWNSALQGGQRPITSLPNPTILPIFFALFVFVLMLLPFVINWDADGVELPWVHKRNQLSQEQSLQQQAGPQEGLQGSYQTTADLAGNPAQRASQAQEQAINQAPAASYEQQLLYASQQSYAQNANQQTQAVNPAAQQNYAAQPNYSQMGYPQENYGQNYAPVAQPQRRHRVFVER
ncbi:MAG: hypothetical protein Q8T09_23225 [Candidatus Melainabacteria bacterium]|nr:hypothetical protein [Candidatus Melainabacteria bacterium]